MSFHISDLPEFNRQFSKDTQMDSVHMKDAEHHLLPSKYKSKAQ